MKSKLNNRIRSANNLLIVFSLLIISIIAPAVSFAQDNNDIVNQLYQQIINSSAIHKVISPPSVKPNPVSSTEDDSISSTHTLPSDLSTPSSEQLKKKIELIQNDIELRHSATVKFMQDDK